MRSFIDMFRQPLIATLAAIAVLVGVNDAALAINGNNDAFGPWQSYVPTFAGQTDQPSVPGYTTQTGNYKVFGGNVFFNFNVVSSGTVTKTTTTDNFAVTLPTASANTSGNTYVPCTVQNATPITIGITGVIAPNSSQLTFLGLSSGSVIGNPSTMTWATTAPGIGVLSHVITASCGGMYQSGI